MSSTAIITKTFRTDWKHARHPPAKSTLVLKNTHLLGGPDSFPHAVFSRPPCCSAPRSLRRFGVCSLLLPPSPQTCFDPPLPWATLPLCLLLGGIGRRCLGLEAGETRTLCRWPLSNAAAMDSMDTDTASSSISAYPFLSYFLLAVVVGGDDVLLGGGAVIAAATGTCSCLVCSSSAPAATGPWYW